MQWNRRWPIGFLIFAVLGWGILAGLGSWQVARHHWKTGLIERYEKNVSVPPANPEELFSQPAPDPQQWEYRQITLETTDETTQQPNRTRPPSEALTPERITTAPVAFLVGRSAAGEPGLHALVPVSFNDRIVAVNLGWVPFHLAEDPQWKNQIDQRLTGHLLVRFERDPNFIRRLFSLDRPPSEGTFFQYNARRLEEFWAIGNLPPYYLVRVRNERHFTHLPEPVLASIRIFNRHFEYILTWYGLAFVWMIIAGLKIRSDWRKQPPS